MMISVISHGQSAPVQELRMASASSTFSNNVPIGTKIYQIDTKQYWVVTSPIVGGTLLNDAILGGWVVQLNADNQSASEVAVSDTDGNFDAENVEEVLAEIADSIAIHRTDIGNLKTTVSNSSASISELSDSISSHRSEINTHLTNIQSNTTSISSNTTEISTNTGDIANHEVRIGELSDSITGILDSIADHRTAIDANAAAIEALDAETNLNAVHTANSLTIESSTGSNANVAMATNTTAGAMSAAQVAILEALNARETETEIISAASDDVSLDINLSKTVVDTESVSVVVNGAMLALGIGYSYVDNVVSILIPVLQYDEIIVKYITDGSAYSG